MNPNRDSRAGKRLVRSAALLVLVSLCACGPVDDSASTSAASGVTPAPRDALNRTGKPAAAAAGRTWGVLINGGSNAETNYRSHLLHVRRMHRLFLDAGVPEERLTIFLSDGTDPGADLAVIDPDPVENAWIVSHLPAGRALTAKVELVDSTIDAVDVRPASRQELQAWSASFAEIVEPGDRVLFYVTDHGWRNPADISNNAIMLWHERLTVDELGAILAPIREKARVVFFMSQCFSGAFGRLSRPARGLEPDGQVCGYFASSGHRQAYGCYPENRGRDNVGYSFRLLDALRTFPDFDRAHERVVLDDRTPDDPHRTSDSYLRGRLNVAAARAGRSIDAYADELLEQAWADEIHYREQFELLDRLGEAFGAFSPRRFTELVDRMANLQPLVEDLRASARRWRGALRELAAENYFSLLRADDDWRAVAEPGFLEGLFPEERVETLGLLIDALSEHAQNEGRWERMRTYEQMRSEAGDAAYRMATRFGAGLRMRAHLLRIAGLVYLDRYASGAERAAFERLVECETGRLPAKAPRTRDIKRPEPYPELARELELLAAVLPGWLGVETRPLPAAERSNAGLAEGAVRVFKVEPASPAAAAGILPGDIVIGPPGEAFASRGALRDWVITAPVDEERDLELVRGGRRFVVRLRVGAPPT